MFQGRYGLDKLNKALLFAAAGLWAAALFLRRGSPAHTAVSVLSVALFVLTALRMFSRDFAARQRELYRYLSFETHLRAQWARFRDSLRGKKPVRDADEIKDRRKYKYLKCPQCSQRLRVPRGKGKLRVTCTRCGCRFQTKS